MKTLKISLDFLAGPLWPGKFTGDGQETPRVEAL